MLENTAKSNVSLLSSLTAEFTMQSQMNEFVESISLVANSIFGLFSNRNFEETATSFFQLNTVVETSKTTIYNLHKKLNCQDFLSYLEKVEVQSIQHISPDFFNNITKHFGRSQSIENFSKLLFHLTRIYGVQTIFFKNFFYSSRDSQETFLLISYTNNWDYSIITETKDFIAERILLSALDKMTNNHQTEEIFIILNKFLSYPESDKNTDFTTVVNKMLFHLSMSLASRKDSASLRELVKLLPHSRLNTCLITFNKILDIIGKNSLDFELADMVFKSIIEKGLTPNVVSYNCYMESYSIHGNFKKVEEILKLMTSFGVEPDSFSFMILIKSTKNLSQDDVFKVHTLVFDLYMKSTCRDQITLNTLIDHCIVYNQDDLAMKIFNTLKSGSLSFGPDNITYNIIFKFAIKNRDFIFGKQLIGEVIRLKFKPNLSTLNSLINNCLKANSIEHAMYFYDTLKTLDIIPDGFTYSIMLNGAKSLKMDNSIVQQILNDIKHSIINSTCKLDEIVFNSILEILFIYDTIDQFDFFYQEMKRQKIQESAFTFSMLFKKLSKNEEFDKIDALFDEFISRKVAISDFNYGFILDHFAKAKRMDWAEAIYQKLRNSKIELSSIIFTTMIKGFINIGDLDKAIQTFEDVKSLVNQPGMIITYNCALDVFVLQGKIDEAVLLFNEIEQKFRLDLISYSTLVKGFCKANKRPKALDLIKKMIDSKIEYDISIINLFLEACAASDDNKLGIQSFEYFRAQKAVFNEITMGIMVKIYGACYKLKDAFDLYELFAEIGCKPSLIFFTNLIHVSFYNKKPNKAELVFTLMKKDGVRGDKLMYSKLIEGLIRYKQITKILLYVKAAVEDQCTLKQELIDSLHEIFEDDEEMCEWLEKVRHSGKFSQNKDEIKNKLKNNYHQTNTQQYKDQIWQKTRERQDLERAEQKIKEQETRAVENPGRKGFGTAIVFEKKVESTGFKTQFNRDTTQKSAQTPLVLHNFRSNNKASK